MELGVELIPRPRIAFLVLYNNKNNKVEAKPFKLYELAGKKIPQAMQN
jgi:hypothetical protein